ncbi:MAG: hypothetical protein SGI73_17590 [Chloroflexota bacterium]|nr:hypothetical protein [Chloroflexota bacterium]
MRVRRRNLVWLAIMGVLTGIVVVSGVNPAMSALMVGAFGVAAVATLLEIQPERLISRSRSSLTAMRMSPDAREAVERARRRGALMHDGLTLLDVGLIALQSGREGMDMERTRSVSMDDDGVRPYITLRVDPHNADRTGVIRFEIIDHNGETQFVHEMRTFLRDGEMNIVADHQLPLYGNRKITGVGDWDLRISVDGALVGALSFAISPSINARYARADAAAPASQPAAVPERERLTRLEDSANDDAPVSLEDLLRNQSRRDRGERN